MQDLLSEGCFFTLWILAQNFTALKDQESRDPFSLILFGQYIYIYIYTLRIIMCVCIHIDR